MQYDEFFINNSHKLSLALEQSPVSIVITNVSGDIEYTNSKFSEITGYSFEEVKGKNLRILSTHEKTKEEYKQLWDNILSGKEWRGEFHNKKKNGELFWENAYISPIKDASGIITHFIAIKENITEKKEIFKALEESEFKFRELIENSVDGIIITDQYANIKLVNSEACKMLGYTAEELLAPNSHITYIGNNKIDFIRNFEDLKAKEHISYEREINIKNGSSFSSEVTVRRIKNNGYQVIIRDITERKNSEKRIHLQAKMLDQVGQAVIAVDTEGRIIYFNNAAEKLYNQNLNDALGKSIIEILPALEKEEIEKIYNVLSKGGAWGGEISVSTNNSLVPIFLTINPVFESGNFPIGAIGVSFDLSEQKRKEKEMREAKEKAEEMNKLKSSFLANMSHELRTPMVGILGFSEILLDEIKELKHKEMIKSIFNSGQRLLNTLNLILDLSRIESNKMEIKYSSFDLQKLITETVNLFKGAALVKNLLLDFESPYFTFDIYSDEKIIHNIISNLLHNAVKFTKEGYVKINLFTEFVSDKEYAVICISDTGIGISAEHQKIIFDEFRQISEGFNRSFEGAGLGLTLTKKFVSLLEGYISLQSVPGIGTKFFIYIPLKPAADISAKKTGIKELIPDRAYNELPALLLVENDEVTVSLTKKHLDILCSIKTAKDAEAALRLTEKYTFDLILMDINLGSSLNGVELTKILRNRPNYSAIPIIAFTAFAMETDKEEFLSAGCTDFLSKPFTKSALQSKVKQYLNKKIQIA